MVLVCPGRGSPATALLPFNRAPSLLVQPKSPAPKRAGLRAFIGAALNKTMICSGCDYDREEILTIDGDFLSILPLPILCYNYINGLMEENIAIVEGSG
jgi:hypothetical protein